MNKYLYMYSFLMLACSETEKETESEPSSEVSLPDADGDGFSTVDGDCNDNDASVYPGASERCDDVDNNCDGSIDEGLAVSTFYQDNDGDGYGNASVAQDSCENSLSGYVTNSNDCNDAEALAWTGASESCDGVDNNCVGGVDEGFPLYTFYVDSDGDGYGTPSSFVESCTQPSGYVSNSNDCNDAEALAWTGASESCDGVDNNCNGGVDEGTSAATYYEDNDGDGYGNISVSIQTCNTPPAGYTTISGDCDDTSSDAYPGGLEYCDGIDNDCNGSVDDSNIDEDCNGIIDRHERVFQVETQYYDNNFCGLNTNRQLICYSDMGSNLSNTTDYYGTSSSSGLYSFARILYGATNSSNPNNSFTQPWVIAQNGTGTISTWWGDPNVGDPWTMGGGIQTMLTKWNNQYSYGNWDNGPHWFQGVLTSNNVLMTNVSSFSNSDQVSSISSVRQVDTFAYMEYAHADVVITGVLTNGDGFANVPANSGNGFEPLPSSHTTNLLQLKYAGGATDLTNGGHFRGGYASIDTSGTLATWIYDYTQNTFTILTITNQSNTPYIQIDGGISKTEPAFCAVKQNNNLTCWKIIWDTNTYTLEFPFYTIPSPLATNVEQVQFSYSLNGWDQPVCTIKTSGNITCFDLEDPSGRQEDLTTNFTSIGFENGASISYESNCTDGLDNDSDGDVDCNDLNCVNNPACATVSYETSCTDGVDNDSDGVTDCNDSDCAFDAACSSVSYETSCTDGVDNDSDGDTDCDDSDCAADAACQSSGGCASNQILDCNGNCGPVSWLGDMYCDDETYTYQGVYIDYNCVSLAYDNGDCGTVSYETSCTDGVDNDSDGVTDCNDSDCAAAAACQTGGGGCCYDVLMYDSYGDGWNGAAIDIYVNSSYSQSFTVSSGSYDSGLFCMASGQTYDLVFTSGSYDSECSMSLEDSSTGSVLYSSTSLSAGTLTSGYCN